MTRTRPLRPPSRSELPNRTESPRFLRRPNTLRGLSHEEDEQVLARGAWHRAFGGQQGRQLDNALAETINGLYKAELIHRRAPWKTKEAVEFATLEWVSWFNHHRLLEPIGYIPPAEAEANYYRQLASQATAEVG
jgi:hypothetical protein